MRKLIFNFNELESAIKKAEKDLASMKAKKMAAEVIAAQEKTIQDLKAQLEKFEKIELSKVKLTFSIVNDKTMEVTEHAYRVAFVKNNRPIDHKKVDGFIPLIANGKYEKAYPIIAAPTKLLIENGYHVIDFDGREVQEHEAEEFIVILDGQHRTLAFLNCSITNPYVVPNTHMREDKNIGEYLVEINDVGSSWNQRDRFSVAALTSDDRLVQEIANRIHDGFNPSTAALIYTKKKITTKQVNNLLRGEKMKLPKGADINIERGNMFIQLCKEANMPVKYITRRYFINAFNSHAVSVGEDTAFEALRKLKNLHLTEEQLDAIKDNLGFIEMLTAAA
jgi:nitrate reductase NapAB chaperone NapD